MPVVVAGGGGQRLSLRLSPVRGDDLGLLPRYEDARGSSLGFDGGARFGSVRSEAATAPSKPKPSGQIEIVLEKMEDVQKSLNEIMEKLATVTLEIKATSAEVHDFRKQMEDYGADLDGVKRQVADASRKVAPPLPPLELPARNKGALTNHSAPLLRIPLDGPSNLNRAFFTSGPGGAP
ncbi:hypothetical protein QYE76_039198 [Lolium multiflorum]|uniref:Uncharacterized protein n=1 Tax=Lolium multiflorum TaxID=4521 RepID=A0AAD8T8W7_LOLMU|nr:hypothetical protein QYE76_039198 [Lolium multiflorum]